MKKCLVLIRDTKKYGNRKKDSKEIEFLYESTVIPAVTKLGYVCERVDPHDYGINDSRLFNLIASADAMIIDASSESADYFYSLGARHALTDKPTLILVANVMPFDLHIPKGVIHFNYSDLSSIDKSRDLYNKILEELQELEGALDSESYSPVLKAIREQPRVFLSYAHADAESVLAVDQWLRNRGARVDLDERNFIAGRDIKDEIIRHVKRAGKVVCFYSKSSADRYYPKLERRLTEEMEREFHGTSEQRTILLYFRLDDTPLPAESAYRLAINAWTMGFNEACKDLWRNLLEAEAEPKPISLVKYARRAPWKNTSKKGNA